MHKFRNNPSEFQIIPETESKTQISSTAEKTCIGYENFILKY